MELLPLWRSKQSEFFQYVVKELCTARVHAHGRVRVIRLHRKQVHRDGPRTHAVFVLAQRVCHPVHAERKVLAALVEVYADVLGRILGRRGALDADVAVRQHEVILLAERGIEVYVGLEVRLLVVLGIHVIQFVGPHDAQHTLAFGTYLVDVHASGIPQNVVLFVQFNHTAGGIRIHNAVFKFLVIGYGTAVYAYVAHLDVRFRTVDDNVLRHVLGEVERGVVDVGPCPVAVHIDVHQTVFVTCGYDKGYLYPLVGDVVRTQFDFTGNKFVILIGIIHRLSRLETRVLGRD